jgi:Secretion system C-terminal sorting domain
MDKKTYFLFTVFIIILNCTRAQTLSPNVNSSAGDYYSAGGYSLSFTVGEMTMVNTVSGGSSILTQGFQQPEDLFTLVPTIPVPGYLSELYPNPGNGHFHLSIETPRQTNLQIEIVDVLGKLVLSQNELQEKGPQVHELDITDKAEGIYFIKINIMDVNEKSLYSSSGKLQLLR